VVNPFTGEAVPVWVANFVLGEYGTGAVMAVPAHDQRDFEFAARFGLPVRRVIHPAGAAAGAGPMGEAFTDDGVLADSGRFSGLASAEARTALAAAAREGGFGDATVQFRLKDWGISRQ